MTKRLTKHGKTTHENGICCTHFSGEECVKLQGDCSNGCLWEEKVWEKLAHYEDLEEQGRLITLPCAVGSLVWEIGIFDTGEEAGLFRAKPFALSDMEWDRLGNTVFLTLDEAIQKWKEIDTFGGFAEEIANVEAALKGAEE